jgi:hypothetical protein
MENVAREKRGATIGEASVRSECLAWRISDMNHSGTGSICISVYLPYYGRSYHRQQALLLNSQLIRVISPDVLFVRVKPVSQGWSRIVANQPLEPTNNLALVGHRYSILKQELGKGT